MKSAAFFALSLTLAGCGTNASVGNEPESLAMTDDVAITASSQTAANVMVIEVGGERFELTAGICNTYDDGTFRFSLAEGPVGDVGRGTATIERFDTGSGHEIIFAFEGLRDDNSEIAWYARGNIPVHELTFAIFGSSLQGTAVFDSIGGQDTPGNKSVGTFAIRCE